MYPEFIVIYVLLAIVIALLGVLLFFVLKLLKNGGGSQAQSSKTNFNVANDVYTAPAAQQYQQQYQQYQQNAYQGQAGGGVCFCKRCATQFDASQSFCPNCGTPR